MRQIGSISVLENPTVLRGHHECHTGVAVETTGARLEDCDLDNCEGGPVIIKKPRLAKKGG